MRQRPSHLRTRQLRGVAFGEPATLVRVTGSRDDDHGEYSETETSTEIVCASAPVTGVDEERRRLLSEAGVQLDAGRLFWLVETPDPVTTTHGGDIIVYEGERWRVSEAQRWGNFSEVLGIRIEPQPVP